MTPSFRLVIFDCDGVLVDTERIAVPLERIALARLGWRLSEAEIVDRFLGRTEEEMLAVIERHLGRPVPADWRTESESRLRDAFATHLQPVDGVVDVLDRLRVPACVASSGSLTKMRYTLGLTGLYPRFVDRLFSATEVAHGKPAPDLFRHAARRMGVPAAACAVVEDSRAGVQAARAAGMRAFGYAGGLTPAAALAGPGTVVFEDMRVLPALLDRPDGAEPGR